MPSVFSGGQTHNGGFKADQLELTFGGDPVSGFLVQNVQFSYTQQITMLYEIGSANVYYVGGRAQGSATLARVIGPAPLAAQFITKYNDLCNPQDIDFKTSAGCDTGGIDYTLEDAVLTTIAVNVTSQDVVINEQLQFIFADLDSPQISTGGAFGV
jgi:hypothetical protein